MIGKATFFNAPDTVQQLLAVQMHEDETVCKNRAKQLKRLGRDIPLFKQDIWMDKSFSVMLGCVLAKFSQHEDLRQHLLSTGDFYIAESADYDDIWGSLHVHVS